LYPTRTRGISRNLREGNVVEVHGKKLIVVGDRILVTPESGDAKTRLGLLLPPTAIEKMAVQGGHVVDVGPGTPVAHPADLNEEPWKLESREGKVRYVPMEAEIGDYALFLRNAAVEVEFEGEKYLIVPQGAILLLVRDGARKKPDETEFDEKDFRL
jgi:co-chaperonin GroES (HSP10)